PHLHQVRLLLLRVVDLGVEDARARAHALGQPRVDDPLVAHRVLVLELAADHPGHDLHVAVRVRGEARRRADVVLDVDEQEPVMSVRRVPMGAEAEAVPSVEPVDARAEAVLAAHGLDEALFVVAAHNASIRSMLNCLSKEIRPPPPSRAFGTAASARPAPPAPAHPSSWPRAARGAGKTSP